MTCVIDERILFYAFRYALGRMTYAVGDACTAVTDNLANLSEALKIKLIREITEAEERNALGMEMDKVLWLRLRETVREHLR